MDSNPLVNAIIWGIQILTAGVLLFHTSFKMLTDVRQKHTPPLENERSEHSVTRAPAPASSESQELGARDGEHELSIHKSSEEK